MERGLLKLLCCPQCGGELAEHGSALHCACGNEYPVIDGIPRFVPSDNYAASFGIQWNTFRRTQLDSFSGVPISRNRFFNFTGWTPESLEGALVLDVGCGAGRFTEIALSCGGRVVAMDYSRAVDACRANHEQHPGLMLVQADIYSMPFRTGAFDFVYCLGVLQHTPDVQRAFLSLPRVLRTGGRLAVDVYPKLRGNWLWPKYWLRPITTRLPSSVLFPAVRAAVRVLWPLSAGLGRVPRIGRKLRYALPIVNYEGVYPLSPPQLKEWAVLDTFDMLAPAFDQPQTEGTLARWFDAAGLKDVEVFRSGFLVGRGSR